MSSLGLNSLALGGLSLNNSSMMSGVPQHPNQAHSLGGGVPVSHSHLNNLQPVSGLGVHHQQHQQAHQQHPATAAGLHAGMMSAGQQAASLKMMRVGGGSAGLPGSQILGTEHFTACASVS
jgi:hypothetical protein